jgi:DNA-binding MurR/RpiR family transcriptional regulator
MRIVRRVLDQAWEKTPEWIFPTHSLLKARVNLTTFAIPLLSVRRHMTRELNTDQLEVVSWLTTPESERKPETLEELAAEIGVRPATIRRWRTRKLDALAAEEARMRLLEHLPEVYQTLANKAQEGSHEHIGLFLRIAAGQPAVACEEMEPKRCKGGENYA